MSSLLPVSDHIDIEANRNKLEAYQHIKYDISIDNPNKINKDSR